MLYVTDGQLGGTSTESVYQYSLSRAFDLSSTITLLRSRDLEAHFDTLVPATGEREPQGIEFNQDGTRMFLIGTTGNEVNQYTLSEGFNIATATFDGGLRMGGNPGGIAFSPSGMKMYVANNQFATPSYTNVEGSGRFQNAIREFHLPCPFNLFAGKCTAITEGDRTGMAEAQVNIAKKTIEHSTDTALNRLKWIRRNKDLQDLSLRNIKLNFSNQMLASLTEVIQASTTPKETSKDERLNTSFHYDHIFGTVLNRFIVQAVNNHPLSVYGNGGQSRAFIHISDTAKCIELALKNHKFENKKVRIFNQVSEVYKVKELAELISKKFNVNIDYLDNPRKELAENDLEVSNKGFMNLGFKPKLLNDGLVEDVKFIANETKESFNKKNVNNSPSW